MTAAIAALRTYLRSVIGLGATTPVGANCANDIIEEGFSSISDLVDLSHKNGVKTICTNVRKPAGLIPQPDREAPNPNPQNLQVPLTPCSGHLIPMMCEQ